MPQVKRFVVGEGTVRGDKSLGDHQIFTAGATQAQDVPVVLNRVITARHQKGEALRGLTRLEWRRHPAQDGPLAEITAAGKRPASLQAEAAVHAFNMACGRQGCRDLDTGVSMPDVLLRLWGEEAEQPNQLPPAERVV